MNRPVNWLRDLVGRTDRRASKSRLARTKLKWDGLTLERLEDRTAPAANLTIVEGAAGSGDQDANLLADGQILFADADVGANTVSTGALVQLASNQSVLVQASSTITFSNLSAQIGRASC